MADFVHPGFTIKNLTTNLADYDRMIESLEKRPEATTLADWRIEWLTVFMRRQMARFESASRREAIRQRTVSNADVAGA